MFWWIDTFKIYPGQYYRYLVNGENDLNPEMPYFCWRVPSLRGRYAFRLRIVD